MIIIVESGATKTSWCAVSGGAEPVLVQTPGMNLATMPFDSVRYIVQEAVAAFHQKGVLGEARELHYYAAGLITEGEDEVPSLASSLHELFTRLYPGALIRYSSDTLAAARSVCGHKPGIAAILGTGSNSCFFDGRGIVDNVRPGGFILGNEGGADRLGKMFLSDFIKGLVPEPVAGEFASDFEADYLTVVKNVYRSDAPSRYLGSFAPWIVGRYGGCEYVKELVDRNFRDFIERCLMRYDIRNHPVGVVGGFGHACKNIIEEVSRPYGISFSGFIPNPMEGLVDYHLGRERR